MNAQFFIFLLIYFYIFGIQQVVSNDTTFFAAATVSFNDGNGRSVFPFEGVHLVLGALGLILSWVFTNGIGGEELVEQGAELFNRFCLFGLMKVIYSAAVSTSSASIGVIADSVSNENSLEYSINSAIAESREDDPRNTDTMTIIGVENAPVFYTDDLNTAWLRPKWPVQYITVLLDTYHLLKRYKKDALKTNKFAFYSFCQQLSLCFAKTVQGILPPGNLIIAKINKLKEHFEKPEFGGVWNDHVTEAHRIQSPYILHNLALPKVTS
jgi:hypothetical protein